MITSEKHTWFRPFLILRSYLTLLPLSLCRLILTLKLLQYVIKVGVFILLVSCIPTFLPNFRSQNHFLRNLESSRREKWLIWILLFSSFGRHSLHIRWALGTQIPDLLLNDLLGDFPLDLYDSWGLDKCFFGHFSSRVPTTHNNVMVLTSILVNLSHATEAI